METKGKRLAIIDADSILYRIALSAEMCAKGQGMNGEDMWFNVRQPEDCYQETLEKLDEVVEKLGADDAIICLSDARCFRYDILPSYKANRERTRRPPMMITLREALLDRKPFKMVRSVPRLEADDLCGIASTALSLPGSHTEAIVVSEDKDLLTVPGILHQRGATFTVSLEEADRQHMYQTMIGDVVDNYKGIPGVGPKTAERILNEAEGETLEAWWLVTKAAFLKKGMTEQQALTQARVARILRNEDWNPTTTEIRLWAPPS